MLNACKYLILIGLILLSNACLDQSKKEKITKKEAVVLTLKSPAKSSSSLPFLFANDSQLLLSWVEKIGDSLSVLKYAEMVDDVWQTPNEIIKNTDWFVNWADYPMIAVHEGNLWSHVLKKSSNGTYSYDVKMNVLPKGDSVWRSDLALHTDNTPTEHGFVTVLPYNNAFFVSWLDGRNTEENEVGERGAMTLRAAEVSLHGKVSSEVELDATTCDCCQTTGAITENGPVVIYRDRSAQEIRDISIVRKIGDTWTAPKTISSDHWNIKGCPVNGPKAAALQNTLVVAWFTAAQENPRVQLVFSDDNGENFDLPIPIADGHVLGRVDVDLIDSNTALVSWMESKDKLTTLKAAKVSRKGTPLTKRVITTMDGSRKSGFPQMELLGETIYFAWTDYTEKGSKVETAIMDLKEF